MSLRILPTPRRSTAARNRRLRLTRKRRRRSALPNLFNHTNLGTPNRFVNTPQFGTITDTMTSARQIQFVLRYNF